MTNPHAPADRFAFQLRKDHEQALHRLPDRRRRLKTLRAGLKCDAVLRKQPQELRKVRKVPADPVKLIDQNPADRIRADVREQRVQGGAVGILAGIAAVAVDTDRLIRGDILPAELLLRFQRDAVGAVCGLPHIDRGMLQRSSPPRFVYSTLRLRQTMPAQLTFPAEYAKIQRDVSCDMPCPIT